MPQPNPLDRPSAVRLAKLYDLGIGCCGPSTHRLPIIRAADELLRAHGRTTGRKDQGSGISSLAGLDRQVPRGRSVRPNRRIAMRGARISQIYRQAAAAFRLVTEGVPGAWIDRREVLRRYENRNLALAIDITTCRGCAREVKGDECLRSRAAIKCRRSDCRRRDRTCSRHRHQHASQDLPDLHGPKPIRTSCAVQRGIHGPERCADRCRSRTARLPAVDPCRTGC